MKIIAALTATAAIWAGTAQADVTLRLAHWVPAQHAVQTTGFEPWADSIREASDGRITIEIYPAQQLGAAADHYDMARDGIADIAYVNPGYQPGRFPIAGLAEVPLNFANATGGSRAFDEWYRDYVEAEMPDIHMCLGFVHDPGTLHSTRPIRVPGDLSGMNVRPAQATVGRYVSLLGGANVQASAPDSREILARGAAEATFFPWDSVFLFGIDSVTKNHLDLPLYVTSFVMAMNRASYDALSPEDRQVMDDHCTTDWAERMAAGWAAQEASGRDKAIEAGHELYAPTEEETAEWRASVEPLMDAWSGDVAATGADPDAIHARLIDLLRSNDALNE